MLSARLIPTIATAPLPDALVQIIIRHFGRPDFAEKLERYGESMCIERVEIKGRSGVYMIRYFIEDRGNAGRTYLHHILRPDEDPEFHDHPWGFDAYILINGYVEQRAHITGLLAPALTNITHHPGSHYRIDANTFHRIAELPRGDVWSIIRTGPKEKSWSFLNYTTRKLTPWRDFVAAKEGLGALP